MANYNADSNVCSSNGYESIDIPTFCAANSGHIGDADPLVSCMLYNVSTDHGECNNE